MASLSYPKSVRLHHRKAFQALLDGGNTHYNAVFKVFWKVNALPGAEKAPCGDGSGTSATNQTQNVAVSSISGTSATNQAQNVADCRFAVSVPKRNFKRAVKRNLLKRRTREAIRLNRQILPEGFAADFLFFFRPAEVLDYAAIEKAVIDTFGDVAAKAAAAQVPAPQTAISLEGNVTSEDNPDKSHE